MSTQIRLASVTWLVACLVLPACSSASKASSLRTDVQDFARYMRWGQVEKAADLVPSAHRIAFIAQKRAAQNNMVIHEYDIRAVDPDIAGDKARVLIAATWSRPNDPVMRSELFEQHWEWTDRHWQMVEQKPVETPETSSPQDGL